MKIQLFRYFILLIASYTASAQSLSPTVLSAQSGYDQSEDILLAWTLGEQFTETIDYPDRVYTQGFHQPLILKFPQVEPFIEEPFFDVVLSPNPVESTLNVNITTSQSMQYQLILRDVQGKVLYQIQTAPNVSVLEIPVGLLSSGIYFLQCLDEKDKSVGVYKILKI